jgi:hypothetical protein
MFATRVREWGALVALACLGVVQLPARDLFVDNLAGDDRRNGLTPTVSGQSDGPIRSLQLAVSVAHYGDRVILRPTGIAYRGGVVIAGAANPGGDSRLPITLEGNDAVISGIEPFDATEWEIASRTHYRVSRAYPAILTTDRLFLDGQPVPRSQTYPKAGEYAVIEGRFVYQPKTPGPIDKLPFAWTPINAGLTIHRSNHWIIRNLTIEGFRLDGLQVLGPVKGIRLENVTLRANGRAGLTLKNLAEVELVQSTLDANANQAYRVENGAKLTGKWKAMGAAGITLTGGRAAPQANP